MVLVDSPPILAANDALLLSRASSMRCSWSSEREVPIWTRCGGPRNNWSRRRPFIGAVLNRFDPRIHGKSSQPYRGYYRSSKS